MFSTTLVPKNMREVLSSVEGISFIKSSVKENINLSRAQLVKIICHKYHLISPDGRYQRSGCNSVLISLESQNKITLPKPRAGKKKKFVSMKRLNEEVPLPSSMPASIDQLDEPLKIILIEKEDAHLKLIWNELIATEHPQGEKRLAGFQIKYLVTYKGYYVCACSFSSSSFQLKAREDWIGWTKDQQEEHLQKVLNLSRFLIRKGLSCNNLASYLLSKFLKRIKSDFFNRYQRELWLVETFVEQSKYAGICYQATNWIHVGETKGRGRNDTKHKGDTGIKDIYLYVINSSFRKIGNIEKDEDDTENKYSAIDLTEGLSSEEWAFHEFGNIQTGDKKIDKRLVKVAEDKGRSPSSSYAAAVGGEKKDIVAYYRMTKNYQKKVHREAEARGETVKYKLSFDKTISQHRNQTNRRAASFDTCSACTRKNYKKRSTTLYTS